MHLAGKANSKQKNKPKWRLIPSIDVMCKRTIRLVTWKPSHPSPEAFYILLFVNLGLEVILNCNGFILFIMSLGFMSLDNVSKEKLSSSYIS